MSLSTVIMSCSLLKRKSSISHVDMTTVMVGTHRIAMSTMRLKIVFMVVYYRFNTAISFVVFLMREVLLLL